MVDNGLSLEQFKERITELGRQELRRKGFSERSIAEGERFFEQSRINQLQEEQRRASQRTGVLSESQLRSLQQQANERTKRLAEARRKLAEAQKKIEIQKRIVEERDRLKKEIEKRQKKDKTIEWDCVIMVDGIEGSGKSTLAITIAWYISNANITPYNIVTGSNDAVMKLKELPNGSTLVIDEGSLIFSSKETMKREQS